MIARVKVGDVVLLRNEHGGRARGSAVVIRVGRKWMTTEHGGRYRVTDGVSDCLNCRALTAEQWATRDAADAAWSELADLGYRASLEYRDRAVGGQTDAEVVHVLACVRAYREAQKA